MAPHACTTPAQLTGRIIVIKVREPIYDRQTSGSDA
jgi:hypothetical protein